MLNAHQAAPEGGIIEVVAENVRGHGGDDANLSVRLSIRDFGCGIPADILPRIFDPYFTTKPGASGLGLATAYAIVAKHNGRLSVHSKPGIETVVTIDLPATTEVAATPTPAKSAPETAGRILVMDDEEALRKLLKTVLTSVGYEVETVPDGAAAIALYETAKGQGRGFAVVLLDLTVPGGMGGLETAAKLKELDPSARLIVSSGYSDTPVMAEYARHGFEAALPKPWTIAQLTDLFRRMLRPVAEPGRRS